MISCCSSSSSEETSDIRFLSSQELSTSYYKKGRMTFSPRLRTSQLDRDSPTGFYSKKLQNNDFEFLKSKP